MPSQPGKVVPLHSVQPHNLEAEQSVLGACIGFPEAIALIADALSPGDFYRPDHGLIFGAILTLWQTGQERHFLAVVEQLERTGKLEQAGGISYLNALWDSVPTGASVEWNANQVKETSVRRSMIRAGQSLQALARDPDELAELLNRAEEEVFALGHKASGDSWVVMRDLVKITLQGLQARFGDKRTVIGVASGYPVLDDLTAGFQPGQLAIICGRPGSGKTALALNIAQNAASRGDPVAFFSLEMGGEELAGRMFSREARIDADLIRKVRLGPDEWKRVVRATERIGSLPLYCDQTAAQTPLGLRARARRLKAKVPDLALVVVDYLQLMRCPKRERREEEVADASRSLKALAKELQVPVLALAQLNRQCEQRDDKRPRLSDLRESGSLEQDSDVVLGVYRPQLYDKYAKDACEVNILKQRNGPLGTAYMAFLGQFTSFEPAAAPGGAGGSY